MDRQERIVAWRLPGQGLGPKPPPRDPYEESRVAALIEACASEPIRDELYPAWAIAASELEQFVERMASEPDEDERLKSFRLNVVLRQKGKAVAEQIRRELQPREPPPPPGVFERFMRFMRSLRGSVGRRVRGS
jgi:hypothetical protein